MLSTGTSFILEDVSHHLKAESPPPLCNSNNIMLLSVKLYSILFLYRINIIGLVRSTKQLFARTRDGGRAKSWNCMHVVTPIGRFTSQIIRTAIQCCSDRCAVHCGISVTRFVMLSGTWTGSSHCVDFLVYSVTWYAIETAQHNINNTPERVHVKVALEAGHSIECKLTPAIMQMDHLLQCVRKPKIKKNQKPNKTQ